MPQTESRMTRYNIVVSNKPGQLAKLTKYLSDENMKVCALQVANLGKNASIQLLMPPGCGLQEGLRKKGLLARVE